MKVFLSYRRDDSESVVHRLHEHLCEEVGEESVFLDTRGGIRGGDEWFHTIRGWLYHAEVLLAVIGRTWLSETNAARLADPGDILRQELEIALGRGILLVPVLVEKADMPSREALPESLARLADKQYVELSNRKFDRDIEDVLDLLRPHRGGDHDGDDHDPEPWPEPPVPTQPVHLGAVLPGTWSQQVTYPNGIVGQATAQYYPNGTFYIQGHTPMGPFTIQGTWSVDGFNQLWMAGQSQAGFMVTPFSTSARFSHISPASMTGTMATGEHLAWQRVG